MNHVIEPLEARIAPAALITLSGPGHVTEGNTSATALFTVTLSEAAPDEGVTVHFETFDGTATMAGNDYVAQSDTLTFAKGETVKTIEVSVVGDLAVEADETFSLKLSSPSANAAIATDPSTGALKDTVEATIVNDDFVKISIADAPTVAEGGKASFVVSLSEASPVTVSFTYATKDGTAVAGKGDFTALSGTLEFAPGETSKTIEVSTLADATYEGGGTETFSLELSSPLNATLSKTSATGTIEDTDAKPTLSIADVTVVEGASVSFVVKLSGAHQTPVSINYETADGTAKVGDGDYTGLKGTLVFAEGETSKTVVINTKDDTHYEPGGESFSLNVSGTFEGTPLDTSATATLTDNDHAPSFSIGDVTISEGNAGSKTAIFTVTLNAYDGTTPVTVDFDTADGTAVSSGDYADFTKTSGTLTFAPGQKTQTISVPILGDLRHEATESFSVNLKNPTVGVDLPGAAAKGIITDDGDPVPTVTLQSATSVVEGHDGTAKMVFTVSLSEPSDQQVTVSYNTVDGTAVSSGDGADFAASSNGVLIFAPGEKTKTIEVTVNGDTTVEADENFSLKLSNPVNATFGAGAGSTLSSTGTILNDDGATLVIKGAPVVTESATGVLEAKFTVELAHAVAYPVTVEYFTVDGTAKAGSDFTGVSGDAHQTLTFAAGETSKTITIPVLDDLVGEVTENFSVKLANASSNATIVQDTATGTIVDNEPTLTLSAVKTSVTEGNPGGSPQTATFTVTLSSAPTGDVTVHYGTVAGTATASTGTTLGDYTPISGTLTFTKEGFAKDGTQTITVPIVGDTLYESDESFKVVLSEVSDGARIATGEATVSILNDEPTVSVTAVSVAEGTSATAGTKNMEFIVTLSAASQVPITLNYATADYAEGETTGGRATAGEDYTATSGSITFAVGGPLIQKIVVPMSTDSKNEPDEAFKFLLSMNGSDASPAFAITTGSVAGTILNDDPLAGIDSLTGVQEGSVQDPHSAIFTLSLNNVTSIDRVFTYTVEGVTAVAGQDFTVPSDSTVTVKAGQTRATFAIPLIGDRVHEGTESFKVTLVGDDLDPSRTVATATIIDDDPLPVLSVGNVSVLEGAQGITPAVFNLHLSSVSSTDVSVLVSTVDGSATTAKDDYVKTVKTVIIPAGQLDQTFSIDVLGDTRGELDETFSVVLSSPSANATLSGASTGTATILNDDTTVSVGNATFLEGSTTGFFTVTRAGGDLSKTVTVDYATQGGTASGQATEGLDFLNAHGTIVFGANEVSKQIPIEIKSDALNDEGAETFSLVLSNVQNADIVKTAGTGTILDGKSFLSIGNVSMLEGDSGVSKATFTVTRSGDLSQAASVDFATSDGTAKNLAFYGSSAADYQSKTGTLSFNAGQATATFDVLVIGDQFKEGNETFTVNLSNAKNTLIGTGTAVGTILEDATDVKAGLIVRDAKVVEGDLISDGKGGKVASSTTISFTVELTAAVDTPVTFSAQTLSGTALDGTDFNRLAPTFYTINPGSTSLTITTQVLGNDTFDGGVTKAFNLELSQVTSEVLAGEFLAGDLKATGFIFNDDQEFSADFRTLRYMDVDGDVATVHISKGFFVPSDFTFSPTKSAVGGVQLQSVNLADPTRFSHADFSVTAVAAPGFPGDFSGKASDGNANVGWIKANIPDPSTFQFKNGVDLHSVTIDGDLGRIDAGDNFVNAAIGTLKVGSFGMKTSTTLPSGASATSSILSSITTFSVGQKGTGVGDYAGDMVFYGGAYGRIGTLTIEGALNGVAGKASIKFPGSIGKLTIGSVLGGSSEGSARIFGDTAFLTTIKSLTVKGDLTGGSALSSGSIRANTLGTVHLGSVHGGTGMHSGSIISDGKITSLTVDGEIAGSIHGTPLSVADANGDPATSGVIYAKQSIGTVVLKGDLVGGVSAYSGSVQTPGKIGSLTTKNLVGGAGVASGKVLVGGAGTVHVMGDILGGTGNASGGIESNSTLGLGKVTVDGSIRGGNSSADTALLNSGAILTQGKITSLLIKGDVIAGTDGGKGIAASGAVRAEGSIGSLTVLGNVTGNSGLSVLFSASGFSKINLGADASKVINFAKILAGYGGALSTETAGTIAAGTQYGKGTSADAQIGSVLIGGSVKALDIVAGATVGVDGHFGTIDDQLIAALVDKPVLSRIASVIVKGSVEAGGAAFGVVAQRIDSIRIGALKAIVLPSNAILHTQEIVSGTPGTQWTAVQIPSAI